MLNYYRNIIRIISGITLIALVVTIVVLLILAGITISLVFSENGIIAKAREAAEKTNQAVINEQVQMNDVTAAMENMLNVAGGNGTTPEPEPEEPANDGNYSETKGVNTPKLTAEMEPIKYDAENSRWVKADKTSNDWYNYSAGEWANVVIGGQFDGSGVLNESADGYSMFVWIPRYAYNITSGYHSNAAGTIDVVFLKGTSDEIGSSAEAAGKSIVSYGEASANGVSTHKFVEGKYVVHPAFVGDANLGGGYGNNSGASDNGISGIWVAKFEASPEGATTNVSNSQYNGTDKKLQVKPGVSSWRSITISNIYDVCKAYNETLNSHLMKNSEWGAVAYLSRSEYGRDDEVWINNSSSFITGSAGNSPSEATDTGTDTNYKSEQGVHASTTNNVYGIYDMSGGAWEYVAAYVDNKNPSLTSYGNSLYTSTDAKTKNVYTAGNEDTRLSHYNANTSKYGDAIYETSSGTYNSSGDSNQQSWIDDYSDFPYSSAPFFERGGNYSNTSGAGLFCFFSSYGDSFSSGSFRPVLVAL